jgi:Dicarboxylate transport
VRRIFYGIGTVVGGGTILVFAAFVMRISIAEYTAQYVLRDLGFQKTSLNISTFSSDGMSLQQLSLGDAIQIESLEIDYDLVSLFGGKVTAIRLDGVNIDVSAPNTGALSTIQKLAQRSNSASAKSGPPSFPKVEFNRLTLSENISNRRWTFDVNGQMDVSSNLKVEGQLRGELAAQSGILKFKAPIISLEGNLQTKRGVFTMTGAEITPALDNVEVQPLLVTVNATVLEDKMTFLASAKTPEQISLVAFDGQHDLTTGAGAVQIDITDLSFSPEGLQPVDLVSVLDIPAFTGIFNGQSQAQWQKDGISASGHLIVTDFSQVIVDQGVDLSAAKTNITFEAVTNLNDPVMTIDGQLSIPNFWGAYAGNKISASELLVSVKGSPENVAMILSGSVQALPKKTYPVPLNISGEMTKVAADIQFNLSAESPKKSLKFALSGAHDLKRGMGTAKLQLLPLLFKEGGLQPTHFWSDAKITDNTLLGEFAGSVNSSWSEGAAFKTSLNFDLKDGGFIGSNYKLSDMNLNGRSAEFLPNEKIAITLDQVRGNAVFDGEDVSVRSKPIRLNIHANRKDADFHLPSLFIEPGAKSKWKPNITIAGQGTLLSDNLNFTLGATTDLMGQLIEISGDHSITEGRGNAVIELLQIPFDEDGIQPADLLRGVDPKIRVTGSVGGLVKTHWNKASSNGSLLLDLTDIGIMKDGMEITGLNGEIFADSLMPLSINTQQTLSADLLFAAIPFKLPVLNFRILPGGGNPILMIDRFAVGLFGGAVQIKDDQIDTGKTENLVELRFSKLSLEDLLALGEFDEVAASGQLSGKIPLSFDGKKLVIELGNLKAEGPGFLQVRSENARQALAQGGPQAKLLLDVLENFKYSKLSLEIRKPANGEDQVKLQTQGSNPDVEDNRAVILNVNLSTNLDKIFNTLLEGYRLSEEALRATVRNRKK